MAEKVVKSFTNEEKERVLNIQSKVVSITARLGEIEVDVRGLDDKFKQLKDEKEQLLSSYGELRLEESKLSTELREKYGDGTYDVKTNTFTPTE